MDTSSTCPDRLEYPTTTQKTIVRHCHVYTTSGCHIIRDVTCNSSITYIYTVSQPSLGRMERIRCLPTVHVVDDSSNEVGEWIPTRHEFLQLYEGVRMSGNKPRISRTSLKQPEVFDIIPTSRKIGKRTFVEGCFDVVLLLACWVGNVPVVSYLLTTYLQYFSIDTLIDKCMSVYNFESPPVFRKTKGMARFEQATSDKVSLLHAAAEGLQLDVIKLLLLAGANVNNPSKWLISPLMSALMHAVSGRRSQSTIAGLINSGADINCRDANGMTPLMYSASISSGVNLVQMLIKASANPYAIDSEGFTALHHACMEKCTKVVKYLLKIAPWFAFTSRKVISCMSRAIS